MRISSGMIFDAGVSGINRQTASLLHIQQQVSSGTRILTPSDDPVAAARALEVTQSKDVVSQLTKNQGYATSALGLEETQLTGFGDVLGRVRQLAVQSGNASLNASDRRSIATELRTRFDELLGIANASDGMGQHMFAGFMGATAPFSGNVDAIISGAATDVTYSGDQGQRTLQVSPGRYIPVSDSGNDVFMQIKSGNGYFATDYAIGNTGTGIIDPGSVTDPVAWGASAAKNVAINFTVTAAGTTYDLVDLATGDSLLTGGPGAAPVGSQRIFQSGQLISLKSQGAEPPFDLGASTSITGVPATGDSFSIDPGASQSIFATVAKLIGALEAPSGTSAASAKYTNDIAVALSNIDQGTNNILRVRAGIGSRMNEVDSLDSLNQSLTLQYQQTLSGLQDLDYAKAITDLTRKQTDLQAAQQSFAKISQLSLFNYL